MARAVNASRLKKALSRQAEMNISSSEEVDDLQALIDGVIGEDYLIGITGATDLNKLDFLEIIIDTSVQSIFGLSELLPNLKSLVLDNSIISSVRDLGVGLRYITFLSLASCGLSDLDGIGVLTGLQEICLSDNFIQDVAPLAMHENLQV